MKKFFRLAKLMIEWMGSYSHEEDSDLGKILELRAENIELRSKNQDLREMVAALESALFDGYELEESPDLNQLMAQYGMFFANSSFDRFRTEEYFFFRQISMQFMGCAYQLGLNKHERTKASTKE